MVKCQQPVNIVSFLWGDWCNGRGDEYVSRMARMLERCMDRPYIYYIISDRGADPFRIDEENGVVWTKLPDWVKEGMPGNMKKLYIYYPENDLTGRTILLDLDMVFTGSLAPFMDYSGVWCGAGNLGGGYGLSGGGFVSFRKEDCQHWLWDKAWKGRTSFTGRERYFYRRYMPENVDTWQKLLGEDKLVSYKWYVKKYGLPEDCRVVHFHGKPRPHEVQHEEFMKRYWK